MHSANILAAILTISQPDSWVCPGKSLGGMAIDGWVVDHWWLEAEKQNRTGPKFSTTGLRSTGASPTHPPHLTTLPILDLFSSENFTGELGRVIKALCTQFHSEFHSAGERYLGNVGKGCSVSFSRLSVLAFILSHSLIVHANVRTKP